MTGSHVHFSYFVNPRRIAVSLSFLKCSQPDDNSVSVSRFIGGKGIHFLSEHIMLAGTEIYPNGEGG